MLSSGLQWGNGGKKAAVIRENQEQQLTRAELVGH